MHESDQKRGLALRRFIALVKADGRPLGLFETFTKLFANAVATGHRRSANLMLAGLTGGTVLVVSTYRKMKHPGAPVPPQFLCSADQMAVPLDQWDTAEPQPAPVIMGRRWMRNRSKFSDGGLSIFEREFDVTVSSNSNKPIPQWRAPGKFKLPNRTRVGLKEWFAASQEVS